VAGACVIENDPEWEAENWLVTVTENGFGKRMKTGEFEAKGRGIQGNIIQRLNEKTGDLCGIATVTEAQDLLMITNEGVIIRTPAKGIPHYGRSASGVILMRLAEGAKLVNFALADSEEEKAGDEDNGDSPDGGAALTGEGDEFVTEMDLGEKSSGEDISDGEPAEAEEIPDGDEE
jgi:DNA gyrase subunit A